MDAVATAKLALDASSFDRGLQRAEASVSQFAKTAGTMIAGAFAFDKIISGFSMAIEKGDKLQDLANRFGVSAASIQEIGNAASLSGAGVDEVAAAMNKLAVNAGKAISGNDAMIKAFQNIGVSVEQLKGMSPQDLFYALSQSVVNTTDPLIAFAQAQEVAGKSVVSLIETLNMGPESIASYGRAMGVMTDEQIAKLSQASDAIKIFQNTITNAFGFILSEFVLPFLTDMQTILDLFAQFRSASVELGKGNFSAAKEIFQGIDRSETRARYAMQTESPKKTTAKMLAEEASTEDVATSLSDKSISKPINMPSSMSIEVFNNIYNEVRAIKGGLFQMQDLLDKRLGVPILRSAS